MDYGMFYQWGKKVGWSSTDPMISSDGSETWNRDIVEGDDVWQATEDPCPDGWRLPTALDFQKLADEEEVVITWTTRGGVHGRTFTDRDTGKSIFLPASGYRNQTAGSFYGEGGAGRFAVTNLFVIFAPQYVTG